MSQKDKFMATARATQVGEAVKSPTVKKRTSGALSGLKGDQIELFVKMKKGVGNRINISLDGDDESEAYLSFRVLSAAEELRIKAEMEATGLNPNSPTKAYDLTYLLKRLSLATSPNPTKTPNEESPVTQPVFTAEELGMTLSEMQVFAISALYQEFSVKQSPNINNWTNDEIKQLVDDLAEVLNEPSPKLQQTALQLIYQDCNSMAIYAALIECTKQLTVLTAQMGK